MQKNGTHIRLEQKEPLVAGNKTYLCADDLRLTTFDLEIAHRELNETEEIKIKSLRKLKEILTKDSAVVYCTDDDFLLRYLRVAKFDSEKACKAVKKFYKVKIKYPHLVLISPQLKKLLQQNFFRRLPYKDQDGCYVSWMKIKNWKTDEMSFDNAMQVTSSILDVMTMIPCLQVNGVIAIYDFQGCTASHVTQVLYPKHLMFLADFLQEIYPWRLKRLILLNFNSALCAGYRVVRQLLKKKNAERIVMIGSDLAELHQYVNPLLLPKEYGGSLDEEECSVTQLVMDSLHYLEYLRLFGSVTDK